MNNCNRRFGFKAITYRCVGWWLTGLLLFVFWVIPLALAICLAGMGLISSNIIKMIKKWWSDQPKEDQ